MHGTFSHNDYVDNDEDDDEDDNDDDDDDDDDDVEDDFGYDDDAEIEDENELVRRPRRPTRVKPASLQAFGCDAGLGHEPLHHVDGQREDDGGVLLGRDGVESLQVA